MLKSLVQVLKPQKGLDFMLKHILAALSAFGIIFLSVFAAEAESEGERAELISGCAAILVEQSTNQVLYELDADKKMPIASVTKTMTMLLIEEAIESGKIKYSDMVTTSEHAASMGGSQVFLEVEEKLSVDEMLKAIAVASGNDAAVAMAEHISGTESEFVKLMNRRAKELGALNTHFINCNGLNETEEHYSTARDVALISAELLKHKDIEKYLTIWTDTIRNGQFALANTNKLIRFYDGANGIKTGSTDAAKYCLSAAAKRDNMQLIAVVLGAPTTKERFENAKTLLDFGFANFALADNSSYEAKLPKIKVRGGAKESLKAKINGSLCVVVKKGSRDKITVKVTTVDEVLAPISVGDKVGEAVFYAGDEELFRRNVVATEEIPRITVWKMFEKCLNKWVMIR